MASIVPAAGERGTRTCIASVGLGQMLRVEGDLDDLGRSIGDALRTPPRARAAPPAFMRGGAPARTRLMSPFSGDADVSERSMVKTSASSGTAIAKGEGECVRPDCVAAIALPVSGCRWPCVLVPTLYSGGTLPSCATIFDSKYPRPNPRLTGVSGPWWELQESSRDVDILIDQKRHL